jgi:hypothetical protein
MDRQRVREAQSYYYHLDPSSYAHVNDLYDLADEFEDLGAVSGANGNLNANIHLEISLHPDVLANEQVDHALWAEELLTAKDTGGEYLINGDEALPYRLHLPFFKHGWTDDARQEVHANLSGALANAADNYIHATSENWSAAKGFACESAVALLIGHTGVKGLMAYPSFERQNRNHVRIDGWPYRWDVTAYSDGTTLEQGEYPIQVKSGPSWKGGQYHPDIIKISMLDHMSIETNRPRRLASLCNQLILFNYVNKFSPNLSLKRNEVLDILTSKGPIKQAPHTMTTSIPSQQI